MTTPPADIGPGNRIADIGALTLYGSFIRRGDEQQPVAGTHASVEESGQITQRTTATRVIGGAIAFGAAGAIVGAIAKKRTDGRGLYLHIDGPDYYWVEELKPSQGAAAREFAAAVARASRWTW